MAHRTLPLITSLIVASSLLAAIPAHAVCGRTPPISVWPHRGVPVPLNAHVVMTALADWRHDATLSLVTAPRRGRPVERVAMKEQVWKTAQVERFDLTPLASLAPNTSYELRSSRGEILGMFTTSVMEDKRPPTWGGVERGSLYRSRANVIDIECGYPLIEVAGASEAVDDQTTSGDIRYALWAGKPGAALDYAAPPLGWASRSAMAKEFSLEYGESELTNDIEVPKDRPLRIGIKAYDLAGNGSAPSEITVNDRW